jgi:hypothetical protein
MIDSDDHSDAKRSLFGRKYDAIVWDAEREPEVTRMHPITTRITMNAHVRDLQRSMHPERNKAPRRRRAWIRKRG